MPERPADIAIRARLACGHVEYARKDWPALMRGPKAGMRL